MPGTQALEAKRAPAFSYDPNELTIIVDKRHPLYDERELMPVERGMVLDVAARGVIVPIAVRRVDDLSVVLAGKQRTKAVAVANALGAGVPYEGGGIPGGHRPINDAIEAWAIDEAFCARLKALMGGKPLRIPAVARNAGGDADARAMMRAENAHRRGDSVRQRIQAAQLAVEKHGDSIEDIAQSENVDPKTVARWLKMDVSGVAKKPKRTNAKGPGKVQIKKWFAHENLGADYKTLFGWLTGQSTREEMLDENPDLKGIV